MGSISRSCTSSYQRAPARTSEWTRCRAARISTAALGNPAVSSGPRKARPRVCIGVINCLVIQRRTSRSRTGVSAPTCTTVPS